MKHLVYIGIIICTLFSSTLFAQDFYDNEDFVAHYLELFKNSTATPTPNNPEQIAVPYQEKSVVQQEGIENYTNLQTKSNAINVKQQGRENFNEFITYYGREDLSIEILQQGVGNSIQIYGENSLINNMKITQKANHQDIIITNH